MSFLATDPSDYGAGRVNLAVKTATQRPCLLSRTRSVVHFKLVLWRYARRARTQTE